MHFGPLIITRWRLILSVVLFLTLIAAFMLVSEALQTSTRFDYLYSSLLVIGSFALIVLISLVLFNLHRLISQLRRRRAGAKLTGRLVVLSVAMAVIPVLIVYYFALAFLNQRLDSWFDVEVEQALKDALELSRVSLDAQMRDALRQTRNMGLDISNAKQKPDVLLLEQLRSRSGASEMSIIAPNGQVLAFNNFDTGSLLPSRPSKSALLQLKQGRDYIGLETFPGKGLHIRVMVSCDPPQSEIKSCLLHALYPVLERLNELATRVDAGAENYQRLVFLRSPLKTSFTLVLSLILLLSVAAAVWVAFFYARRLVAPIRDLAEGTRAVAHGNYNTKLEVTSDDELGFLVNSFNDMTSKISHSRDEVRRSQQFADTQRAYLETVLERLSSGVLSLDHKGCLRTGNAAAEQILGVELRKMQGEHFIGLCAATKTLQPLCDVIKTHLKEKQDEDWQEEVVISDNNSKKTLMCRGTSLPPPVEHIDVPRHVGHVIVFDDITDLIRAQRNAAWTEVARRLAHEIKNPLTPIQLSAERLRHKYLPSFPDKEARTLDRMTHTIIQQVKSLKELVNAFNDYARTPQLKLQHLDLNGLINEVLELYSSHQHRIHTCLAEDLPAIDADPGRIRQVLHNLLKNALEADAEGIVQIITQNTHQNNMDMVELRVEDQGPGVEEDMLERIFEPYTTTKTKGSGLGLPIVKKIVEEHNGVVWLENRREAGIGGVCVALRLPAVNDSTIVTVTESTLKQA